MIRTSLRPYIVMGNLTVVLLLITAAAGVLDNGIYRPFLSEPIVRFQRLQDLLSMILALVLLWAMYAARRSSHRAFVIWTGVLVYVAYYYSFYAFDYVYTVFYPLYLALLGLSVFAFIGLMSGADSSVLLAHVGEHMPVRLIALVLGMTVLFVPIWLIMIVQGIGSGVVQETALVFVLDLSFLIPACVYAAVQIWRRKPTGYLLSGPLLFKASISGILLTGGELLKLQQGHAPAWDQLTLYLFLAGAGLAAFVLYLQHLDSNNDERGKAATRLPLGHRSG
jgi:hypothetical protein